MKKVNKLTWALLLVLVACKTRDWQLRPYESVRWNDMETRVHAFYTTEGEARPKAERYYAWFDKGRIGSSQGGYSGKLLHGRYTAWYSASGQLKEQGFYDCGLKDGLWLVWQEDGALKEKQKWNKGRQVLPRERQGLMKRIRKAWPPKFGRKHVKEDKGNEKDKVRDSTKTTSQ